MQRYKSIIIIVVVLLMMTGCSTAKTALAMMQSTDDFILHSKGNNNFIFKETKISSLANEVEKYLKESIDVVQRAQYKKFIKPINVYAVSTLDSFEKYCGYRLVLGCVVNEKVFLSPRILTQPTGILPRLLTHELSHLHIDQQLNAFEWGNIPTWFREGLAVYVSTKIKSGTKLDLKDAEIKIKEGNSFYPNEVGSIIFPKSHVRFGLSRSTFYRQAASFIIFISKSNKVGFEKLLLSIQEGKEFSVAFKNNIGVTIDSKWSSFVEQL